MKIAGSFRTIREDGVLSLVEISMPDGNTFFACLRKNVYAILSNGIRKQLENSKKLASITVLVPPNIAPEDGVRHDGRVDTFIASPQLFDPADLERRNLTELCYLVISRVLNGSSPPAVVGVVHNQREIDPRKHSATIRMIIPHRGEAKHLASCIHSLVEQSKEADLDICLDEDVTPSTLQAATLITIHRVAPNPAGPYVIRQHFGLCATSDFIGFQDSDDISTPDRVALLLQAAIEEGLDIVGCHELRVDEISQDVKAFRFPLDVSRAMGHRVAHPQLFPTTIMRASAFRSIGGFSTSRIFSSDTQFLLRSYFSLRIGNVDEFLYIRRRHEVSLTNHPATALGTPERRHLDLLWKEHFGRVKSGEIELSDSALSIERTEEEFHFINLRDGVISQAKLDADFDQF